MATKRIKHLGVNKDVKDMKTTRHCRKTLKMTQRNGKVFYVNELKELT